MRVLCCQVADFLIKLAYLRAPTLIGRPLALLGPDERVCATSPEAEASGVHKGMTPRQAQMRCPDVTLQSLDVQLCQEEQAHFVETLAGWMLPVEVSTWGLAYVDMHDLAKNQREAQPLAAQLGREVRQRLGEKLQPSLGWDSSKFTAKAAANSAKPGRMRLVEKTEERRFLTPLPIQLLPLPSDILQQLHWLGIHTLGQFAALPTAAVWQRLGKVGQLAQRCAQGRDERPIVNTTQSMVDAIEIDLELPTAALPIVLDGVMVALKPHLEKLAQQLAGCRRLRLDVHFLNGETRSVDLLCVEPVSEAKRLRTLLAGRLEAITWPAEAYRLTVPLFESGELPTLQLSLFPEAVGQTATPDDLWQTLGAKYGPVFFTGDVMDEGHPTDERRVRLVAAR